MRIAGESNLDAPCEAIWPLIFDPRSLLQLIPGCDEIEQVAPGEYRARLTLRVPALAGAYEGAVKVLQYEAPTFCKIQGEAGGPGGGVAGQASFTLAAEGQQTRITYQGDAQISGPLAGMNPRFAEGVAQTLIRQAIGRLPELARERADAAAQAAAPVAQPGATQPAPRISARLAGLMACLWSRLASIRERLQARAPR